MRLDLANNINPGDIVYNCFMDELVVTSVYKEVADTETFHRLVFGTTDTRFNRVAYDSQDLYLKDLYGETDDEKSWVEWTKNNRDFCELFDHIETIKEIYKIGFCNGFEHKRKVTFEEMMQK